MFLTSLAIKRPLISLSIFPIGYSLYGLYHLHTCRQREYDADKRAFLMLRKKEGAFQTLNSPFNFSSFIKSVYSSHPCDYMRRKRIEKLNNKKN